MMDLVIRNARIYDGSGAAAYTADVAVKDGVIAAIGEVHGRYKSVKSLAWAGTVKYVEDLGGRWCPDLYYGYAIVKDLLDKMENY